MKRRPAGFWVVALAMAACTKDVEPNMAADSGAGRGATEADMTAIAGSESDASATGGSESLCTDCDDCPCNDGRTVLPPSFCGREADLPPDLCDCRRACSLPVRLSCDCGGGRSALLPAYCGGVESAEDGLCACDTVCDAEANDCLILPEPQAGLPRCPEPSSGVGASATVEWADDTGDIYEEAFEGEVEATANERGFELRPLAPVADVVRADISAGGLTWRPQLTPPLTLSVRQDTPWWSELAVDVTDANGLVFAMRSGSFSGMLGAAGGPVRLTEGEATCVGYSGQSGYIPDEAHRLEITVGGERWTLDRGAQGEREVGGERYVFGLSVADEILDHCTTDMPSSWIEFFILRL